MNAPIKVATSFLFVLLEKCLYKQWNTRIMRNHCKR